MIRQTNRICEIYRDLHSKYGSSEKIWPQWCAKRKTKRTREIIAIGAILTQRTSWHNADIALRNLKKENLLSINKIAKLKSLNKLTGLIRPAGFYQSKPKRLWTLCQFIVNGYGDINNFSKEDLSVARGKLLDLYGIGPETADTILLYALDKPSFVIDEYTKRFVREKKLSPKFSYDYLKELFEVNLPSDVRIYQDYHVLIIIEQKGRENSLMKRI